jgi:prepilin-type N-terminal cleavage/methylation domain-containing protein
VRRANENVGSLQALTRRRWRFGRTAGGHFPGARERRAVRGFTLLEVLVTLALIALLSGLVIGGTATLLREQPATPEEVMRKAIAMARRYAIENLREVRVTYDNKAKAFIASTIDGKVTYPVELKDELQIDFLATQKNGSMLLGGELVETATIPYVTFYPDGTCTPFRVQMRSNNSSPRVIAIDPWTCAPVLEAPK